MHYNRCGPATGEQDSASRQICIIPLLFCIKWWYNNLVYERNPDTPATTRV